jgi:CubicO group peptidase (beta-lactamase class C family)
MTRVDRVPGTPALRLVLLALLLVPAPARGQEEAAPPPDLDHLVAETMETFGVPGVAVAVVKDGRTLVAKGYGVRDMGRPEPVDAHTLFGIASNTKAFTATALALLVEEGKLEWDAPVIDYLPWFRLSDPFVTAEITVRDLLVHRSGLGLGAGDLLLWPATTYTSEEIVRRLAAVPLSTSFRSAYAYDNVLYVVAGELLEVVSGTSWDEFVTARVLRPAGLPDAVTDYEAARATGNLAATHARVDGRMRRVSAHPSRNDKPAGGILASATDMARWMAVQLDSGRVAGAGPLYSPATTREMWELVTPIPTRPPPPEAKPLRADFNGYALGFFVRDYRGRKIVTHTGGLQGYVSRLTLVPELGLGVAVLTNAEEGGAFQAITLEVLDHYMDAPDHDWLGTFRTLGTRSDSAVAALDRAAAAERDTASRPSLPLPAYVGALSDPWYGDVAIGLEDGGLVIRFAATPALVGDLEHWQHDTFLARWRDRELRADAFVTFDLQPDGSIQEVRMVPASPSVDFSYDFQDLVLTPRADGTGEP